MQVTFVQLLALIPKLKWKAFRLMVAHCDKNHNLILEQTAAMTPGGNIIILYSVSIFLFI